MNKNADADRITGGFAASLPIDWSVIELEKIVRDKIKDGVHKTPTYIGNGVPFITTKDIVKNRIDFRNCRFISKEEHENLIKRTHPEKDDILLTKVGSVGNVAMVEEDSIFSIFVQLALIKPDNRLISPSFLKYALLSPGTHQDIINKSSQSTMKFIGVQKIAKVLIPFPLLSEQKKIAHILSIVQEAKEKTEAVIEATKELKKSLMKYLFTYGPVSVEEAEKVKLKETEIGMIPEEWHVTNLRQVLREGIKNGAFVKRDRFGSGVPFLNVADTYASIHPDLNHVERVKPTADDLDRYQIEPSDIFYVRSSLKREGVGQCCIVEEIETPAIYDCHLMRVRVQEENVFPQYLAYYSVTSTGRRMLITNSKTTTMTTMNQENLSSFILPVPDIENQKRISEILATVDYRIDSETDKKQALDVLFSSLLNNLMTGNIRVNNLELGT